MNAPPVPPIAMIGFGEAARAFLEGWGGRRPGRVTAFDILSHDASRSRPMRERQAQAGVVACDDPAEALGGAGAIFCLVTAAEACAAAETAARSGALATGALWIDGNSAAPSTKRRAAALVEEAGARYVDLAIMAPVRPGLNRVPLLVSGAHAAAASALLGTLGMEPVVAGAEVGHGSTIKMLRSVMVKGMEALSAECFLAARRAGVDEAVLASLDASDPALNWARRASYNLERMTTHGRRRAEEMSEVTATVAELGLPAAMSEATTGWQDRLGALGTDASDEGLSARLDAILRRLEAK